MSSPTSTPKPLPHSGVQNREDEDEVLKVLTKALDEVNEFIEQQYPGGKPRKRSLWERLFG